MEGSGDVVSVKRGMAVLSLVGSGMRHMIGMAVCVYMLCACV